MPFARRRAAAHTSVAPSSRPGAIAMRPVTQEASLQTRGRDWFGSLPLGTRAVVILLVGNYVFCALVGYDAFAEVCMAPHWVLNDMQLHRLVTSAFFHGSVIHLGFNVMAFTPMASSLERHLGSVQFAHMVALFVLLDSCFHVCLALGAATLGYASMRECAIGFSGVIFGLIVVDTHLVAVRERSIFGFFTVPSQWYPLSLLIFIQLLAPNVSFLGHLSGLLVGLTYVRGYLNPVLLRPGTCAAIEQSAACGPAARHPAFIAGGASAAAVAGAGAPSLPTWSFGEGVAAADDDAGRRRWWQMPTFARRGAAEGTFATRAAEGARVGPPTEALDVERGRGGGGGGGSKLPSRTTAERELTAQEAAAKAAESRAGRLAAGGGGSSARPLPPGVDLDDDGAEMESMETASPDGGGALAALTDMGFAEADARAALAAAGGDVAGAVEVLGSRGGSIGGGA